MSIDQAKWRRVHGNDSDANMAASVLSETEQYLDEFGVSIQAFTLYQDITGQTRFAWDSPAKLVMSVRWHTCCEEHPIMIEAVEFFRC